MRVEINALQGWDAALLVEHLPNKQEALSSISSVT